MISKTKNRRKPSRKHHTSFRFAPETIATLDLLVMKINRLSTGPRDVSRTEALDLIIRYSDTVNPGKLVAALYTLPINAQEKAGKTGSK